ncbi:cory-CC-star protein [Neisseriaceae bacterium CLB008]
MTTSLQRLKQWQKQMNQQAHNYYHAPYRATFARAIRDEEDFFMLLVFSETMGLPNPVSLYTLELQAILLPRFHRWHQRMNMPRSPFDHFRCC